MTPPRRIRRSPSPFPPRAGCRRTPPPSSPARACRSSPAAARGDYAAPCSATSRCLLLSASEIARELSQGGAGTSAAPARTSCDSRCRPARIGLLTPLGFGHANVVVAVPQAWIDVRSMADLEDVASTFAATARSVASEHLNLTRSFFASSRGSWRAGARPRASPASGAAT